MQIRQFKTLEYLNFDIVSYFEFRASNFNCIHYMVECEPTDCKLK